MNIPSNTPSEYPEAEKTIRTCTLNDAFRTTFVGGRVMFSSGIRILDTPEILAIVEKIKTFDAFTPENNPHGEHDFGAFEHNDKNIYWKFD